jgi:hypothetical protein
MNLIMNDPVGSSELVSSWSGIKVHCDDVLQRSGAMLAVLKARK